MRHSTSGWESSSWAPRGWTASRAPSIACPPTVETDLTTHLPWLSGETTLWAVGDLDANGTKEYLTELGGLYSGGSIPQLVQGMDRRVRSALSAQGRLFIMDENSLLSEYDEPMSGLLEPDATAAWQRPDGRTAATDYVYGAELFEWDSDADGSPEVFFADATDNAAGDLSGALFYVDPTP